MKKLTTLFLTVLFAGKLLFAQSLDDAKKSLYYGRTTSARQTLEKLIAANPKNAEAIYWLGQTYLNADSIAGAQKVYQDALNAGVNDPWIWVGIGHVELMQGKKDAARQRFEAAITASAQKKKENPDILNAIGRANADGPANVGDPAYAIEKLKRAAALKPNDPDILVNLGINYLKLGPDQGGNAYEAFTNANKIDPKYARGPFRLGKIFHSQGNTEKFLGYYTQAIQADPAFAPAQLELYDYYKDRDVNKARQYLENYMANSDKDCKTDYHYADYLFRSGKYQESLDKAKAMENGPCKNFPRLKVLYAYNYDRLKDSVQARANIESYLSSINPEKVKTDPNIGSDYLFGASVLKRFPGGEQKAIEYLQTALSLDTNRLTRYQYMDTIAHLYRIQGKMPERLEWLLKSYKENPKPSDFDLYNLTDAAINANQFTLADSLSRVYITKKPDQEYGYLLLARTAKAEDVDSTKGSAFDEVQQYIDYLRKTDSVKNATKIKYQYYYIAQVAADKMKDYPKAIEALEKVQIIDPEDTFAKQALPVLRKAVGGRNSTPASRGATTPAKTKTEASKTKTKTKG